MFTEPRIGLQRKDPESSIKLILARTTFDEPCLLAMKCAFQKPDRITQSEVTSRLKPDYCPRVPQPSFR